MINLLITKIGSTIILVLCILLLILWQNNKSLSQKNKLLNQTKQEQVQTIKIQKKVLDVVKNTKPDNLAGNIKRMRQGKL